MAQKAHTPDYGAYYRLRGRARLAKRMLMAERGNRCAACGLVSESARVFHFDHVDSSNKRANVSTLLPGAWEALKAEADKCNMLCAGCHDNKAMVINTAKVERDTPRSLRAERKSGCPLGAEEATIRKYMIMRERRGLFTLGEVEAFIRADEQTRAHAFTQLRGLPVYPPNRKYRLQQLRAEYGWSY